MMPQIRSVWLMMNSYVKKIVNKNTVNATKAKQKSFVIFIELSNCFIPLNLMPYLNDGAVFYEWIE